jgi:hypothetical protein
MMPELELFTVLEKTLQAVDGDKAAIMEQSVDGFPLIGSVEFVRQPDSSDGTPVTHVTLNMSYFVPGKQPFRVLPSEDHLLLKDYWTIDIPIRLKYL